MTENTVPSRLQFRLRGFIEHEYTDDLLQGANGEVYMSAVGLDSSSVKKGADGKPTVGLIHAPQIGDVSDNAGWWRLPARRPPASPARRWVRRFPESEPWSGSPWEFSPVPPTTESSP